MGYESGIFLMIFIITFFVLLSLHSSTHILIAESPLNAGEDINDHGIQQLYFMKEKANGFDRQIEKVSGEDENAEKESLILQKFRALLGLKSFSIRKPRNGDSEYMSPAPSPSPAFEAEAPAPVPVPHIHPHSHPPPSHLRTNLPPHKIRKEDRNDGRFKRILVAVLVSAGAAFVVCVLGLIWFFRRFRKHNKKTGRMMSVYSKKGGTRSRSKYVSSQNSAAKVSSNPGLDLFYLNSLGMDLEHETSYLKRNPENVNISSHSTQKFTLPGMEEPEESNQEATKPESDNASSSSTREIVSVHDDVESRIYESDGAPSQCGDKIIHVEYHSSDDESFHSLCESHSSNLRVSNASAGSLSDASEIFSLNVSTKKSPYASSLSNSPHLPINPASQDLNLTQTPCNPESKTLSIASFPDCQRRFTPPAPPPPPPPPPHVQFPSRIASRASCSSTLPNLSSPRNSDSSKGLNQNPQNDLPMQSPSVIPPPPCPPPFQKGNINSVKGPPPPPSLLPIYTPMGKNGSPLPKLKPLHWDKVRAAPDRSMVWDKLRSSSFELDEEMIESLFGYNLQNSMKNDETKSKTPSPSKHVLEPKRLQNITILSKALNVTAEQVCNALVQGNGLCLQQLEALTKMVPTKEEETKLSSYKGDIKELGSAEQFVGAMLKIPFAFLRIEAMLYKETFEDEVVLLRKSFSMLEEACKELRSSRLFLKLLEAVLKTGNRMNVGTIRGGARAFKLDALLKLADVKGTDGKTTLLHFVVQEIIRSEGIRVSDSIMGKISQRNKTRTVEEREEDYRRMGLDLVSGLSTELYNVKKTATIDLDVLASSVSNLSAEMAKLQHLVHKDLSMDEKSGNFVQSMRFFLNYAEKNLKELKDDEDRVLLHVREITEYFHGHMSKDEANPLRIFVIVRDFLGMLDHVCKELRSLKISSSPNPLASFR